MEYLYRKHEHFCPDLEAAILGACMLEVTAFGRTYGIIDEDVFYYESTKIVYKTIRDLFSRGLGVDILTVKDWLYQAGITELNGTTTYYFVCSLTNHVVGTGHLEEHCKILKRMWMEREIIKLTTGGFKLDGNVMVQLNQLQEALQRIRSGQSKQDWFDMSELMVNLVKHQEKIAKGEEVYITTGIPKLDEKNGGYYAGQFIILGARPSMGKSAFMGQVAIKMAERGKVVGIISMEMANNEIAGRLAAIDSGIDFKAIYRNLFMDEQQKERFHDRIANNTAGLSIFISDETKLNPMDIRAKADKLKRIHGLDVLFIDYLQLISADQGANKNRENVVSEISRACKIMAKDLEIPVIALCQLNRSVTNRQGDARFPQLSDLRESGSLEQDADVVGFIHRDFMAGHTIDENGNSTENKAHIIFRKWRNGEANLIMEVGFDGPRMQFVFDDSYERKYLPEVDYQGDQPFN